MDRRPRPAARRLRFILIAVVFVLLISISTVTTFYTDYLWFDEVGFTSVFLGILGAKALLAVILGAVFFMVSAANLLIVGRVVPVYRLATESGSPIDRYRGSLLPYMRKAAIGGSAVLALLFALGATPLWEGFVLFRNSVDFGINDPVFGRDLSFFVFKLPFLQATYTWAFSSLLLITLIVAGAHYLTGGIRPQSPVERVTPQVKAHLSVLVGLLALLRAWGYRLDQYQLLYSDRGDITGASYTDIHAELPALKLLVVISIIGALLFLVNIRFRGWALPVFGLGLWLLTSLLGAGLYPFIVQRFSVEPAQLQRERPFIARNIEFTRQAYGIDAIEVTEFPVRPGVSAEAIATNQTTVDNIRLWDAETLKTSFKQLQELRPYYQFHDVDVDRYTLDGQRRQVMLSPRELDLDNLPTRTWQNDHIIFTHGYGAVVTPTNATAEEGRPTFLLKDIPPESSAEELKIEQGGIYFGETFDNPQRTYSVVRTEQKEFDYSLDEGEDRTTFYEGEAGVPVKGLARRLAFTWRFRNINLLISGLINSDSRVIYYRQIRDRIAKAAPFLAVDGDPYLTIVDGKLFWIVDAFTTSDMYPYSERFEFGNRTQVRGDPGAGPSFSGTNNYIRNSVKVTVDAYNGTMTLYVWDEKDPVIQAWRKVFPELFTDRSQIPPGLEEHVRYPEDLFRIQSGVYTRYHMTEPETFYTNEDIWVIPARPSQEAAVAVTGGLGARATTLGQEMEPYYVLMRLPGSTKEDYVLILPMNPRSRPNMVSLLAAHSDPDDYGELKDFRFPRGVTVFGVGQIHSRINAVERISRTISLLDQRGSKVILGNLLVIPIGESILYSQPLFIQAEANPIPELKYVILASSETVVMEPTLEDALAAMLGTRPPSPLPDPTGEQPSVDETLIEEAYRHLVAADEAARRGDWETYGREQEAARDALQRAVEGEPSASPTP